MTEIGHEPPRSFAPVRRRRSPVAAAVPAVAVTGAGVLVALMLTPGPRPEAVAVGLLCFAVTAAIVLMRLEPHHPHARFGAGNAVTLARAGGASVLAGVAATPAVLIGSGGQHLAWAVFAAAVALLALDGVDGWAARRDGTASAFGARFDMEADAFFTLVLSALALGLGKAGPWVLAVGLMRYAFLAAGRLVPRLAQTLPESLRRKAICVIQVGCLTLILAPPVQPPLSTAVAAAALAALAWSFATDVRWLLRAERPR